MEKRGQNPQYDGLWPKLSTDYYQESNDIDITYD